MTPDPTGEAERRARRRAVARQHHPDLGGDPEEFVRAMRAIDEPGPATGATGATRPQPPPGARGPVVLTSSVRSRVVRTVRTSTTGVVRLVRERIPASWPGSRRYGRL